MAVPKFSVTTEATPPIMGAARSSASSETSKTRNSSSVSVARMSSLSATIIRAASPGLAKPILHGSNSVCDRRHGRTNSGSLAIFAAVRRASSWVSGLAADSAGFVLKYRRLAAFPFAGVPIVAGDATLDHFVAPLVARHDEGSEVAAPEAKRAERHHNEGPQEQLAHRSSS